ncbi:L-piperidine-6-carboxylate dehydrogenase [Woeseia oceani]|uniref:aldehyde dehydrogenase (NAD(+)) n=1 Tax=Woeseia oceani TaxID=1548547 RepID=A0A193LEQ2_9GAMM|nr:aldehyde dehydrogenase family protein [Woeseia oceani]ANO50987.1 aldehyde dehydrogenase [Woeseia oceani]
MTMKTEVAELLVRLGVPASQIDTGTLKVTTPLTGEEIGSVKKATVEDVNAQIETAHAAFLQWRLVPAPRRGELVRLLGEELRKAKDDLGRLVSIEVGKIPSEGLGEVQEMIDICDFAVGLSRQLYGLTIASERPGHKMTEVWHPLGVTGVISAFNFPVAVWSWNTALALVCGNSVVWKPSEKTPLTALACTAIMDRAVERFADAPAGLHQLALADRVGGAALVESPRVPLISATGSTAMGRQVGPRVAERFGRSILELGGNNAGIVSEQADLDITLRAVVFSAVGTTGQRCTSMRRLLAHDTVYDEFVAKVKKAYATVTVGNPLASNSLVGPLIDKFAYEQMQKALADARALGATVTGGERVLEDEYPDAYYVRPALVEMPEQTGPMLEETFAPILYAVRYTNLADALDTHNAVGAGLSSAIFTLNMRESEQFLGAAGSDCGIANVNIGTSGAEIGGAFGGEKETGGGRESGSDSWKGYMRRATNTINYSTELPLAQGVSFDF